MKFRSAVSAALRSTIGLRVLLPYWRVLLKNNAFCLMLHRIDTHDRRRLRPNENMKVSPDYLENFIRNAQIRGYRFISMSELAESLNKGNIPPQSIVLTLDDGYKDNFIYGFPIFRKYNVPFTVYLSTCFMENAQYPWWYMLEDLLLARQKIKWNENIYEIPSDSSKESLFMAIRGCVLEDSKDPAGVISNLFLQNGYENAPQKRELFMNWAELREMSADPLAELGNHGHSHLNMAELNESDIKNEFLTANELIRRHTGRRPEHYCYPYGYHNSNTLKVLKDLQAATCVTTAAGEIGHSLAGDFPLTLPRFMLTEGKQIESLLSDAAYLRIRKYFWK